MINNKHKAEQDKATINQRVAEVPRMCMCMCVCMCVCVCARARARRPAGWRVGALPVLAGTAFLVLASSNHRIPSLPAQFSSGCAELHVCMCGVQVDKRLSNMTLHGSVVPHKKDIDELRDTSKKEVFTHAHTHTHTHTHTHV